ncbi:hypothetical protein BST95_17880 [Halioglobus japonicus]|uniref:TonB-dependent receptor n=1 Tax=Halioglobus japonicus TaxID=930805 RepID=A0AAP8SP21_9GAMM|nr:TonB-dependent receptor [Halioglobus japonicus]AQA19836.1 hypothetical protein BST95_17880 [Halioglobus japonicus]PLW87089.1 TonB-dependent receptor [Halioglobus japonicus]GHD10260.1 TonB-dependent receptor [Halioglobus japonicus]
MSNPSTDRGLQAATKKPLHKAVKTALFALGASTLAIPAFAQTSAGGYSLALEEIVVTAQKREEDFMSVPGSVNAFTTQDMINTGAATIQDIDTFMPGVDIADTVGGTTQFGISIRGISSPNISSGQDASVAVFYDGSYMPRAVTSIPFTDISRTEVLKGPQGTLFGRNATAGVINIVPNKPHEEFEGFVKARVGNQNMLRMEGMVNAPVTDNVFFRGNLFSHQRNGFTETATNGDDFRNEGFIAGRGVLLWDVSEDTSVQLAADFEDRDEMPRAAIGVNPKYSYQGSEDPFRSKDQHDVAGAGNAYDSNRNNEEETRKMYGVSLQIDHVINDAWSMFGIVSYREWETTNLQEEDGTAQMRRYLDTNNIEDSDILYSEIRFNFVQDNLDLILGANYSQEDVFQRTDIGLLADSYMQFVSIDLLPEVGIEPDQDTHAWDIFGDQPDQWWLDVSNFAGVAVLPPEFSGEYFTETMDNTGDFVNWGVFIDGTYQLTDTIRIAAGLRYSYDEKDYSWQTYPSTIDWPIAPARVNYNPAETGAPEDQWFGKFESSDDWNKTTGRLVADWEFSDIAMAYASYSTGYKSGGFDGQSFKSVQTGSFAPEEIQSFEVGLKGDFFNETLRTELSVFRHELDDRQVQRDIKEGPDDPTAAPGIVSEDLEVDGIELLLTWTVTDSLRLGALTTYRETEETSDTYFNSAGELAGGETIEDDSGTEYTLKFDWTPEIPTGFLLVHAHYVYNEDTGPNEDTAIYTTGPWYFQDQKLLNARISWTNDDENIEIALWGNNLLDEEYAVNPGGLAADVLGAYHTRIDDQLTYGLDLRYSF